MRGLRDCPKLATEYIILDNFVREITHKRTGGDRRNLPNNICIIYAVGM